MLKRANDLVRNGIHPASIISGYRVEKLGKVPLVNCAKTSCRRCTSSEDDQCKRGSQIPGPIKGINVLKTHGKGVKDSYLLNGYDPKYWPCCSRNAYLDFNLQKTKMQLGVQVLVTDPRELEKIR
ncbi:hypothetical protein OIU84_012813 [Salix udensis]|uniref:Uncharacterized protein n=1 Tax=Salix udensis TaxID=889485 RepID=A0AAD6JGF7_9ROSI|nr:hypothetical protein OIU84_012813 [Salix udensis]